MKLANLYREEYLNKKETIEKEVQLRSSQSKARTEPSINRPEPSKPVRDSQGSAMGRQRSFSFGLMNKPQALQTQNKAKIVRQGTINFGTGRDSTLIRNGASRANKSLKVGAGRDSSLVRGD